MRGNMDPPPTIPDKTNKKVSRACNTCRLKRKKCDGLDPCLFCTDNKLQCSYSREPRRRGPPSGYLRYTETRAALLETLLGLFILQSATPDGKSDDPLLEAVKTLRVESKTCTQDVWDTHKAAWTNSESSRILEDLATSFSPFAQRPEQETSAKPLLPPLLGNNAKRTNSNASQSPSQRHISPTAWPGQSQMVVSTSDGYTVSGAYPNRTSQVLSRESFERTQQVGSTSMTSPSAAGCVDLSSHISHNSPSAGETETHHWPASLPHNGFSETSYPFPRDNKSETPQIVYSAASPELSNSYNSKDYNRENLQMLTGPGTTILDMDVEAADSLSELHEQNGTYPGSYWRTADLALSELAASPSAFKVPLYPLPAANGIDLPPPHILSNLIDVYFQYVHPSFPFLPPRSSLDTVLSSPTPRSEGTNTLILALCAYSGRLSPSLDAMSSSSFGAAGDAGRVAADLWYEQARTALNASLRKGSSVEAVQTLLLLGLRDHGKGNEGQAWLLVGVAVRMGQDLDLSSEYPAARTHEKAKVSSEERQLRRNVWGVSVILDLLLSLQLGRPPAISDPLRSTPPCSSKDDVLASSLIPGMTSHPQTLFVHTVALCQIISRINFHLYLGFGRTGAQPQSEILSTLKTELEMWHHMLPRQYQISIGHQPERDVLEVNMLYHVAIILLYRPFSKDKTMQHAADVFLEAASTFNVLLEKYRQAQPQPSSRFASSFSFSNPNMIYLIFTVAVAHLSGFKLRQHQQQGDAPHSAMTRSTTMALQTQLHLLNCLDALTSIAGTWELARRCWKTLDRLMDLEGMKPRAVSASGSLPGAGKVNPGLGKRKREGEVVAHGEHLLGANGEGPHLGHQQRTDTTRTAPNYSHPLGTIDMQNAPPAHEGTHLAPSSSFLSWSGGSNIPTHSLSPLPLPTDFFDPTIFSPTRWLPEDIEPDSIGLGMVWDGEWDEGLWTRNLGLGFDDRTG